MFGNCRIEPAFLLLFFLCVVIVVGSGQNDHQTDSSNYGGGKASSLRMRRPGKGTLIDEETCATMKRRERFTSGKRALTNVQFLVFT